MMKSNRFAVALCVFFSWFLCYCSSGKLAGPDSPTPPVPGEKPSIRNIAPQSALAGEQVVIVGANFGSDRSVVSVAFDENQAEIVSFSSEKIDVITPPYPSGAISAKVRVRVGDLSSDPFVFSYDYPDPEIESISPSEAAAGTNVEIIGSGFGNSKEEMVVTFGGELATIGSVTGGSIKVQVPAYAGERTVDVQVGIKSKPSNTVAFSYVAKATAPPLSLGDPFILLHDGIYYAYGTGNDRGIPVYTSIDMETWESFSRLALDMNDSYGDRWFWAPEVYYVNGTFYMYYSANEYICVATSASPTGPFRQTEKKPMFDERAIDNGLFIDADGTPYMYFDRFNDGLNIWVTELEDDLMTIKNGTLTKCINVSQPWEEVWPRVNEGPYVIKHKGLYYMTYSANSYESPFYGIGFATANSPMGPWTKYGGNPILQKPRDLEGVGHSAMFNDKDGNLKIVFHSHNRAGVIQPRKMHISSVYFEETNGQTIMKIDQNYITPKLLE